MIELVEKDMINDAVVICSLIIDMQDGLSLSLQETLDSLNNQVLNKNEYLQIILKGTSSEKISNFDEYMSLNKNILFTVDDGSDELVKGEWICLGRAGDIYSPRYFSQIYNYIVDKSMIYISRYLTYSNSHYMQNIFYENARMVAIDKNPEVILDYFDAAWFPKNDFSMFMLAEENFEYASMRILLFTVLQKKRYQIIGKAVAEEVYGADELRHKNIPNEKALKNVYLRAINYSLAANGNVARFVQYGLLALYKKFIVQRHNIKNILDDEDIVLEEYSKLVMYCLSYIDYDVLYKDKVLSLEQKLFILRKGNGCNKYVADKGMLYVTNNNNNLKIAYSPIIEYLFANISDNTLIIEGDIFLPFCVPDSIPCIFFKYDEEKFEAKMKPNYQPETLLEEVISERIFFEVAIPLEVDGEISCWINIDGEHEIKCERYRYSRFFPISTKIENQYFADKGWIIRAKAAKIFVEKDIDKKSCFLELQYSAALDTEQKYIRDYYFSHERSRKIWLLWDRPDAAGDNGEALFLYLMEHKNKAEDYYFVLNKDSKDFERLSRRYPNNVLETGSLRHKKIFTISDILIGSQTDSPMWPLERECCRDIIAQKPFVFLQHGITKNDMSSNYSKYFQNIRLFVTAGVPEYENTKLIANYGFEENMVQLLGFPRFDLLKKNSEKYVVILPTWRKYCIEKQTNGTYKLKESFEESDYYRFFASLLSNKELLNVCRAHDYKILLMQHNVLKAGDIYFRKFDEIEIADDSWTYNRMISDAALLVTDYSSVSYDFAYLQKPLIYCQFDREKFYKTHTYQEGYFDYERDGFGPVVYDCATAVKKIIQYINKDCTMEEQFEKRVNEFFGYHDSNNCERVASAIREVIMSNE